MEETHADLARKTLIGEDGLPVSLSSGGVLLEIRVRRSEEGKEVVGPEIVEVGEVGKRVGWRRRSDVSRCVWVKGGLSRERVSWRNIDWWKGGTK
jgi:hypothetical protein